MMHDGIYKCSCGSTLREMVYITKERRYQCRACINAMYDALAGMIPVQDVKDAVRAAYDVITEDGLLAIKVATALAAIDALAGPCKTEFVPTAQDLAVRATQDAEPRPGGGEVDAGKTSENRPTLER